MRDTVKMIYKGGAMVSNISRRIFQHPEFLRHHRRQDEESAKKISNQLKFIKNHFYNESRVYKN